MRSLVFTPDRNQIRKDWSAVFRPESLAFAKFHHIDDDQIVQIDISKPKAKRVEQLISAIDDHAKDGPIDLLACFTHGLKNSLPQFGISAERLAAAVASVKSPTIVVALYACSTGDGAGPNGDDGFGDRLRDFLCQDGSVGCRVVSHTTAGHAVRNPYVRMFEGLGSPVGGTGGSWIVAPGSQLWKKWRAALATGTLRFRFPLMTIADIHAELLGG